MKTIAFTPLPYLARTPNTIDDVDKFLFRWRNGIPFVNRKSLRFSTWGNINSTGGTHESHAPDFTPADAQWPECVEPKVYSLVRCLVEKLKAITYDSCEGHFYREMVHIQPAIRRVGLVFDNRDEWILLASRLCQARDEINNLRNDSPAQLSVSRSRIYSAQGSSKFWEAIDVEFVPAPFVQWADYFSSLDDIYQLTVKNLSQ